MEFIELEKNEDDTINMELPADKAMVWLEREGFLS